MGRGNPLTLWGASAASHEVGARIAIESFWTKQAMDTWEVLRGSRVTILARYMWLKVEIFSTNFKEIFRAQLITLLARGLVEKTFNRISRDNIVTGCTRNISTTSAKKISITFLAPLSRLAALSTSANFGSDDVKHFQSHFSRHYRDQRHSQPLQSLVDVKTFQLHFPFLLLTFFKASDADGNMEDWETFRPLRGFFSLTWKWLG